MQQQQIVFFAEKKLLQRSTDVIITNAMTEKRQVGKLTDRVEAKMQGERVRLATKVTWGFLSAAGGRCMR